MISDPAAIARLRPRLLTFRDFVEEALFNRRWGYYASGAVRFGDGGHFDTFPLALSPYFGIMIARRAHALWRAGGRPDRFEICEVGAGNGQLCLDVLAFAEAHAAEAHTAEAADWRAFATVLRYRIIEKSAALRGRQAAALGALRSRVEWSAVDLSRARRVERRRGPALVVANEVLDCLAHHKVELGRDRVFRVVYVGAEGLSRKRLLTRGQLDASLARGESLEFREFALPLRTVPGLAPFLSRHYAAAEVRRERLPWTYFACPDTEKFVANAGSLYEDAEILLIDYGGDRDYHLGTPGSQRVAAGRPEEKRATPYRAPGRDDVTFLVDFSVAMHAAAAAGMSVEFYGPQSGLAGLSGVRLDRRAVERIIQHRALGWLLAVSGVGPEHRQRSSAISWTRPPGRRRAKTLEREVREAIDEFLGRRETKFQLLILRRRPTRS